MIELIDGTKIKMGRKGEVVLPTLGGKAYRVGNAFEKLDKIESVLKIQSETGKISLDSETVGYMYDLTHMALQRNYPEMTIDEVEDEFGIEELMDCFPLLVSQNPERAKAGMEQLAKNAQKQSTKKVK